MNPPVPPALFWVFFGVWFALGVGTGCFLWLSRNAALKRAVFPWVVIGAGVLFAFFAVLVSGEMWMLAAAIPAVTLISFVNIRMTKFCDACGATLYNHAWFTRLRFCFKCGASLAQGGLGATAGQGEQRRS
jgi:hypothetical protein